MDILDRLVLSYSKVVFCMGRICRLEMLDLEALL